MKYEPYIYAADMRALEAQAVSEGISYKELMENAGSSAAAYLLNNRIVTADSTVVILCGVGNNGGDGYVMARYFAKVFPQQILTVVAVGGFPKTDSAQYMCEQIADPEAVRIIPLENETDLSGCEGVIAEASVIVDAVYGIGFHGTLSPSISALMKCVAQSNAYKIAVDIPSGIDADEGCVSPCAFAADLTLTFASKKRCMLTEESADICGNVVVCDIGISNELIAHYQTRTICINEDVVAKGVPARVQNSHKGTYGSVYALCGSYGMAGAAMLCGTAALRCGVGLLHYLIPKSVYPIVASQVWEAVYHPLKETVDGGLAVEGIDTVLSLTASMHKGAFLCGPGLSQQSETVRFMRKLLPRMSLPAVIDADGLNAFVGHIDEWKAISDRGIPLVLTPHPAEAARLLNCTVQRIESDRIASAKKLVALTGATVILKGHHTIVANRQCVYVNTTGCSGLAKGGSGDVLAGMVAALMAQGVDALPASCAAVYLHGLASQRVSDRLSETGMLPRDILDELPILLSKFEKRE